VTEAKALIICSEVSIQNAIVKIEVCCNFILCFIGGATKCNVLGHVDCYDLLSVSSQISHSSTSFAFCDLYASRNMDI
jgi:hypothetical protein